MSRRAGSKPRVLPTSPFVRKEYVPPSTADFVVGERVTLDSWGMGKVVEIFEDAVVVDFGKAGIRRIPAGTRGFSRL